jgi:hypothetical protein
LFHKQFVFKLKTKTNDRNNVNSSRDRYRSFDLYSNADGYSSAFASSVSKLELTNGYPSNDLPIATTVKIKSTGLCKFCRSYYTLLIVIIFYPQ